MKLFAALVLLSNILLAQGRGPARAVPQPCAADEATIALPAQALTITIGGVSFSIMLSSEEITGTLKESRCPPNIHAVVNDGTPLPFPDRPKGDTVYVQNSRNLAEHIAQRMYQEYIVPNVPKHKTQAQLAEDAIAQAQAIAKAIADQKAREGANAPKVAPVVAPPK